jgi:hypothetical protein|nr:MAG TPA: hypothetical protein [Caudoviricetes sp.]
MNKEQEETIDRLRKITNRQILYGNKYGIVIEEFKKLQEDIETVLNMLKEKGTEINKYKRKNKELSNQLLKIYKEQDNYNARIEKKDKVIDLMAKYIADIDNEDICFEIENKHCDKNMDYGECEDCIKQYFERKAEKE